MMKFQKTINHGIKRLRLQHGITQEKFAELVGLTVEAVRNLEYNRYSPTAKTIDSICGAFGITPIDLLMSDTTPDKENLLEVISQKLQNSNPAELHRVSDIIDLLRKKY